MQDHAKAVIIGGGMMGVGLLYHLALEGWTDSVLVEKGELTSGSTWHAAGQCPSFTASYGLAMIHHYGNTLYPKLEQMTGQYVSWHGSGGIRFALTSEEVDYFHRVQGVADLVGFRMKIITPEEIKAINPLVNTDGVLAGALTLDDGHVDPSGCCNALAVAAQNLGATIIRHNRATGLTQTADGLWIVHTEKGDITCEHVVNAAGSYAAKVAAWAGTQVPMMNMKHRYVVTEPVQAFVQADKEMPVMRDPYPSAYYRQEQESLLVGVYETEGSEEAWAGTDGPAWESSNELFEKNIEPIIPWLERVMERMPVFEEVGIKRVVNGAISHTPDANPLLGPAPGARNFWYACGASIGIAQGAGCGKYLAQWMVRGAAEINMTPFDPRRFGHFADEAYCRAMAFQDYEHMYILHLPGEERPAGRLKRCSPLYDTLLAKGGAYTSAYGWERPKWFAKGIEEEPSFRHNNVFEIVAAECRGVRERVGVLDLSSFAKFEVSGPDAEALLNRLTANRLPRRDGRMVLTHGLNHTGTIESEFTITRFSESRYYLLSGASAELRDFDLLTQGKRAEEDITITNITDDYGVLVVSGPHSREVLSSLTDADLGNKAFPWLSAQEITLAGVALRALRVSYVGELGWELHMPMAQLQAVYGAVWEAGEPHGIIDFGVYAVNSLRLEKAYSAWASELTNEVTMIEAGMQRFINFDKGDFIGRDALLKRESEGVSTQMVYLEVTAQGYDAQGDEPLFAGNRVIGMSTSGAYGHCVGKSLAFGYVEPAYATPGTELGIKLYGQIHPVTVLAEAAYDPQSVRLRGID